MRSLERGSFWTVPRTYRGAALRRQGKRLLEATVSDDDSFLTIGIARSSTDPEAGGNYTTGNKNSSMH